MESLKASLESLKIKEWPVKKTRTTSETKGTTFKSH